MKPHASFHKRSHQPGFFELQSCPGCRETLVSPIASEYVGEGRVQHYWSCDACGQEFRTSIKLFKG
jgi:hypothetical protein